MKRFILFALSLILNFTVQAQLFQENFGTAFLSISTVKWPSTCRGGTASSFNTSVGACAAVGDYNYGLSSFGSYITTQAIAIPSSGYNLTFYYSYNSSFSFPAVEIRTGASCGTTLSNTTTLTNTSGVCTAQTISLNAYAGQTVYIRFRSNSSTSFYLDDIEVNTSGGGGGSGGDFKWADNFNDNNLILNYTGNDGNEACTGCGNWTLSTGATLNLVPSSGWNGNSNETEAFPSNMSNVYYARLDRTEYIESPTIDLSGKESVKISFYAKSSSSGTGGGDTWSTSDNLKLQIWNGSAWITVKQISESAFRVEDRISAALPFNYFCFSAYKSNTSPGNYYYNTTPNVNSAYFHSGFKFRVLFEGGFSGAPFAWVDDFTFRADADGHSTMIPCGISFWNQPMATGYGRDPDATSFDDSERGVNLELDNTISFPPNWATQANDGDVADQIFGSGESERVVFAVLSEQEIRFSFPVVHYYSPNTGWRSATMSIDNTYTGPGWLYYNVQYVSCDLASSSIASPTDDFRYYYSFEYGNEFIPVFYQLNKSGIEASGGATALAEVFTAPDVTSSNDCGLLPIELVEIKAAYNPPNIDIHWHTASETNNSGFAVARSTDGINFVEIGWQAALAVEGQGASYYFVDEEGANLGKSLLYYRLRQIDRDGSEFLSDVVVVEVPTALNADIRIYPNPVKDVLHIDVSAMPTAANIRIFNFLGTEIQIVSSNLSKSGLILLDVQDLPSGVYFVRVELENAVQTLRFVRD